MPPDDPLGRSGPTLDNFLRIQPRRGDPPPPCPYGKKCTYGNKCKFHHPERGPLPHKSVTERLVEHAQKQREARGIHSRDSSPGIILITDVFYEFHILMHFEFISKAANTVA